MNALTCIALAFEVRSNCSSWPNSSRTLSTEASSDLLGPPDPWPASTYTGDTRCPRSPTSTYIHTHTYTHLRGSLRLVNLEEHGLVGVALVLAQALHEALCHNTYIHTYTLEEPQ